jgi:hypothetical protein
MIVRPEHFKFRVEAQREQGRELGDLGISAELTESLIPAETADPFFTSAPDYCFFCGEKLTVPAVMWHGRHPTNRNAQAEVWLHPSCAERLVSGLRQDVEELKAAKGPTEDK